ncbi:hypothetical protein DFJ77DRAFT_467472 [Powellomyces hirtus]|nr:hypothetical protein DFJ77DRAFT_467472 [Powellomyces hirtus]
MLTSRIPTRAESRGDSYQQLPASQFSDPTMPLAKRKKQKKKSKASNGHSPSHQSASASNINGHHHEHDEDEDDDDYPEDDTYDSRGREPLRGYAGSSSHPPASPSPGDEALLSDDGGYISPQYVPTESKSKKKKKKKRASDAGHNHRHPDIWYKSDAEEKQRIREFWLQLGEEERRALVKLEKEAVLKKMKEQQKQTCSCSVCGRKRTVIEEELEILYDAYYEELENFANDQGGKSSNGSSPSPRQSESSSSSYRPPPPPPPPIGRIEHEMRAEDGEDDEDDEDDDEDYVDEDDEDDYDEHDPSESIFEFGSSLTVKGGILTVADDFLKNDGRKFLDLMEQLAERKIRQLDDEMDRNGDGNGEWDDGEYDDEEYDEEEEEDSMTEEQRMEEGRRMFQIFAAKMFEQRVLQAYREKVAQERQMHLLAELEKEKELQLLRELTRQKNKEKKRQQKKVLKQQKEEERLAIERKKQEEDERIRLEKEAKQEADRLKREAERARKEEERARKEEEERKRKEAEKARKEEEKKKHREIEEKRRREREERERQEKERKDREEKERKEREARELKERQRKQNEEREKREKEEKQRQELDERTRKEKEEKDRREQEEARIWQQQQQQAAAQRSARPTSGKQPASTPAKQPVQAGPPIPPTHRSGTPGARPAPARPIAMRNQPAAVRATRPPSAQNVHPSVPPQMYQPVQANLLQKPFSAGHSHPNVSAPGQQRQGQQMPMSQPHPGMAVHSRPPNHMALPAFGLPGQRPTGMFPQPGAPHALHPHALAMHGQPPHMMSGGHVSPPPPMSMGQASAKGDVGGDAGLFNGNFAPLHWGPADTDNGVHLNTMADATRGFNGPGAIPIGGMRADSSAHGISPIGPSKAITRPAPIRRPSAIAASSEPIGGASPHRSAPDDDEPVAGSASLGGDILNDDERIGGGSAWRTSAMRKPSLAPSATSTGAPSLSLASSGPVGIPMMGPGMDSFVAPSPHHNNAVRMFEGFSPFGTSWEAPSPISAGGPGFPHSVGPRTGGSADNILSPPGPNLNMGFFPVAYLGNPGAPQPPQQQQQQQQQQQPQTPAAPTSATSSLLPTATSGATAATVASSTAPTPQSQLVSQQQQQQQQTQQQQQQAQAASHHAPGGPWNAGRKLR